MKQLPRHTIYPKDVQTLTGKSRYSAYRILLRIKKKLNKHKSALVTIQEFCEETGTDIKVMQEIVIRQS